jgi:hypothetical protein
VAMVEGVEVHKMLKSLKDFGEFIGLEKGFESELKSRVKSGDKIAIITINQDASFNIENEIEFEKDKEYNEYLFYYIGGKPSVTGTTGIMGVSPFFFEKQNLKPEKVKKSLRYNEVYGDIMGGNDNFIKDYLIYLEQKAQDFDSVNTDWVFFKGFAGRNTNDLHKKFVTHYPKLQRKKDVGDFDGKCSVCGKAGKIRYPDLPFFAVGISNYAHNLKTDHSAFRIRICSDCEPYIAAGWKYVNDLFRGKFYALVPKLRDETTTKDSLESFVKLVNNNLSNFEKLNNVLGDGHIEDEIELSFIVMRKEQKTVIEKFVPNYKTFAIRFENESLIQDDELEYVDWKSKKVVVRSINSFFELERLLKFFFVYSKNQRLSESFHFYQLYNMGIPENKKVQMDSSFKHLMYIYRDNLFSFIYETNLSALNESMLNDICLNFLLYEIRKQREFWGDRAGTNVAFKIMEGLNYYYFIKHKIGGDVKMKEQILSLKLEFEKLENDDAKQEAEKRIEEIVEEDNRRVYYLIGQFIKKIDNFREYKGKNKIFDGFVQSINRKSIKQRFAEDILQKQNYYIEQLNPKAKFIFDLMANNLDKLFEYEPYEEMVIALITGYYSNDILKSSKAGDDANGE